MAARIFTALAILTIIGAAYFGLETEKQVKKLQASFEKQHNDLVATKSALGKTETELKETKETLVTTQDTLVKAEAKLKEAQDSLVTAEASLKETQDKLTALEAEVAVLKSTLANLPGGTTIEGLGDQLKTLLSEKTRLEGEVAKFTTENAELKSEVETLIVSKTELEGTVSKQDGKLKKYEENIMQKGIRGRVMAVNSGWNFVVLNVGDKKGAALNRELVVVRNGQGIGKVKITSVEANQSIADIIPRSMIKGMTVEPGDTVIYTGDDIPKIEAPAESANAAEAAGNN